MELQYINQYPFAETPLARFVRGRLDAISDPEKLEALARSAGYASSAMLFRIARGEARAPVDKAHQLAAAMGVSSAFILGLGSAGHWPDLMLPLANILPSADKAEPPNPKARNVQTTVVEDIPQQQPAPSTEHSSEQPPASENEVQVNLNFKVAASFHQCFRVEAAYRAISLKELLELCFENLPAADRSRRFARDT